MIMDYKIIVIDDQPNNIKAAISNLKKSIELDGFEAKHEMITSAEGLASLCARKHLSQDVDLMLVDKNLGLGKAQDGAKVIKKIRALAANVPVLFYSGEAVAILRQRISKEGIDGVYCCARVDIKVESLNIFRAQVNAILRPQTFRGIFVQKVSCLEHRMRDAVKSCAEFLSDPGSDYVRAGVIRQLENYRETLKEHIDKVSKGADISVALDGRRVMASQLLPILEGLLNMFPNQSASGAFRAVLVDYMEEVVQPRNILAHGELSSCGKYVELGDRKLTLNQKTARENCSLLKRHSVNIDELIAYLADAASATTSEIGAAAGQA